MEFPIIVKLAPRFVNHLSGCEYGSFEDYLWAKAERTPGSPHIVQILTRRKSGIEIRNVPEANEVYFGVASGTFQLAYDAGSGQGFPGALREAQRICKELRDVVTPNVLRWTPDGY